MVTLKIATKMFYYGSSSLNKNTFFNLKIKYLINFRGNIKNNDYESGEELVKYMQPFPMKNTGWHRCAYVLFEHKNPISFKLNSHSTNSKSVLGERSFKAADFHSAYKNDLTPVGLCFFQTEWDLSVKEFFHNKLSIK